MAFYAEKSYENVKTDVFERFGESIEESYRSC